MKGRALLTVAEGLAKQRTEPAQRSAVSRAYYAAFSELSSYLRARLFTGPKGRRSHDDAWKHLKSRIPDSDLTRRAQREALAGLGLRLKERRQKADYRLQSKLAQDEAAQSVKEARRIITELDALDAAKPSL